MKQGDIVPTHRGQVEIVEIVGMPGSQRHWVGLVKRKAYYNAGSGMKFHIKTGEPIKDDSWNRRMLHLDTVEQLT